MSAPSRALPEARRGVAMTNTRIIGPLVAAVFGTLAMLTGLVTVDVAAAQIVHDQRPS